MQEAKKYNTFIYGIIIILLVTPFLAYFTGSWTKYWELVTTLGDEQGYVALATIVFIVFSPELGFIMLLSLLSSAWVNIILKDTLRLPRPPSDQWKIEVKGYGFPSGHAQTSTAFWSAAYIYLRKKAIALLGISLIALVSYSRLALGVHYPRDIIGGIFLGLLVSLLTYFFSLRLLKLEKKRASLTLLAYSIFVSLLYLVDHDPTLIKLAGVLAGSSLYPLLREKIQPSPSLSRRVLLAAIVLALVLILTRISGSLPLISQFAIYAVISVIIVVSPIIRYVSKLF
ncbi:phosphatase PAP2 family protein [Infirmifilum uzonense]|jgi:membrane-associated phospholipid phosphatase|uniref:phosphatase PAP2 family protein n=1 Tax=Infirmifilum TaxID=2856573 RepID=UPI003C74C7CA